MIEKDDLSAIWHGHPSPGTVSSGDLPRIWGMMDLAGLVEVYREILRRSCLVMTQAQYSSGVNLAFPASTPALLSLALASPATLQYLAANPVTLQLILEGLIEDA